MGVSFKHFHEKTSVYQYLYYIAAILVARIATSAIFDFAIRNFTV